MNRTTISKISLCILFISLFFGYASGQVARGKGRITGEVLDSEGNTIVSAILTLEFLGKDVSTLESKTNKRGMFSFMGLGTGQWRITASMDGYIPSSSEIYVRQLEKNPKITITLQKLLPTDKPLIEDEGSFDILDRGNELYEERKFAEALASFKEFFALNPKAYQVRLNIYNCYREMRDYEKAIEQCNIILENVSQDETLGKEMAAKALAGIGECYLLQEDMENAQKYFAQSIETYPENELIAYNVGEIFFSNQNLEEALRYFTLATEIKPDWSESFYKLGLVYLNKADYTKATEIFEKFLTIETDTERAVTVKNILEQIKK
ncbi:tetratricopeptide repeat protein [Acidobacteriota bacterium]